MDLKEVWKDIKDFPMYQVSNHGRIRSWRKVGTKSGRIKEPRLLKPFMVNDYLKIHMTNKDGKHRLLVSRIVGESFIPNPENKPQINHIDGVKTNNKASNLEWCTKSENMQHAYDMGLKKPPAGAMNGKSKLTRNDVLDIRNAYRLGCFSYSHIAEAYGVGKTCIAKIIKRQNWSHI